MSLEPDSPLADVDPEIAALVRAEDQVMLMTDRGQSLRTSVGEIRETGRNAQGVRVMKVADWISEFSGSLTFLFIHIGIFAVWIGLNVAPLTNSRLGGFDPFPFGLLTMAVSLEAIILSVFVLLSQNRQVARDRVRNDIEYEVNIRAEHEISQLHVRVDELESNAVARLDRIEKALAALAKPGESASPSARPPN